MSSDLPEGQQSKPGLSVEVGDRVCDRSGETRPDDTRRYIRLLFNGEGLAWLGPQPQEVADALVAAIGGPAVGSEGRQSNLDLWQFLVDRFHTRDCACEASDLHTEDVWEYYGNFADIAVEVVVARVRADVSEERDRARADLAAIQGAIMRLHVQMPDHVAPRLGFEASDLCRADGERWPCPTIRALRPDAPAESVVGALPDPLPRCARCGSPLGACAPCGMPAQCGEAFCVQHTDPPDWSPPALPDVVGTPDPRCPSRIAHRTGAVIRCFYYRGHTEDRAVVAPLHEAAGTAWRDGDDREIADPATPSAPQEDAHA